MKSYTDIEQSKKLAEILPIESADCCYLLAKESNEVIPIPCFMDIKDLQKEERFLKEVSFIPCWTLSALLEVMPASVQSRYLKLEKTRITNQWYCDYTYLTDNDCHKNPLGAAYEMVCWMLEQGLIRKEGEKC